MRDLTTTSRQTVSSILVPALILCALFIRSESAFTEDARDLDRALEESATLVQALTKDELRKGNRRRPLLNKLQAVANLVSEGECEVARNKVQRDILPKLDGCAVRGSPDKTDWITRCSAQAGLHALLTESEELIRRWCDSGVPFVEGYTSRDVVNLRIDSLGVSPQRALPGEEVALSVTVANVGRVQATGSSLRVFVGDENVSVASLPALAPGATTVVNFGWIAHQPGRHWVVAQTQPGESDVERDRNDNIAQVLLRIGGETAPLPEVEILEPDFEGLNLTAGVSQIVPISVRNPGFATLTEVPIAFTIDGALVPPLPGGDDISEAPVLNLAPGEEMTFQVPWDDPTPGQHIIGTVVGIPEPLPEPSLFIVSSWNVVIPGLLFYCPEEPLNRWTSLGPRMLVHGSGGMPSGSVGRMDRIAFDPIDADTLYAAAPTGGVWMTRNGGDKWSPIGDRLPGLNARGLAVDPGNPSVLYVALIENKGRATKGRGIFKSIDGGATWHSFAAHGTVGDVGELFVRRTGAQVLVYAASKKGVFRYMSADPLALHSTSSDWLPIKSGTVLDLVVHPTQANILYVSVKGGNPGTGVFRTTNATIPSGAASWQRIGPDIFAVKPPVLDLFPGDPRQVYAGVTEAFGPAGGIEQKPWLVVYRSENEGGEWAELKREGINGRNNYNDFIRVDPDNRNVIYFGGVKLYKDPNVATDAAPIPINRIHDDMKQLEFDPHDSNRYYVLSDGGVFRCQVVAGGGDLCTHRNTDLRTTQFYDIDVSPSNKYLMIGGTQDNGTIMYSGDPTWDSIKGGDGLFSLIAPVSDKQVFYAQHQRLQDTRRCELGTQCWWHDWTTANGRDMYDKVSNGNELPRDGNLWAWNNAFIAVHPGNADTLLSQGPEVFATFDGGQNWYPSGPAGSIGGVTVRGHITRVAFQPGSNRWIAGTSQGQLWYTSEPGSWRLLYQHPDVTARPAVVNMAFAPTDANVLYVIFGMGRTADHARIVRLSLNLDLPDQPTVAGFMGGLSKNLIPRTIAGDGHRGDRAYVGTNEGGVFRWDATQPYWKAWTSFNLCLPFSIDIQELIVDPTSKELRAATWGRGAWSAVTGP